jgi:hypothetical protein
MFPFWERRSGMNHTIENQPTALARKTDIVVQEMPEEVLVYDLKSHKAHCLNKSAAFIWEHCDGQTTVADLTKLMSEEFKTPVDESLVWHAIERLGKANLLAKKMSRPNGVTFRSRRAMLGKLGTAALLSVPVVMSITSPVAAAAASVPPICTTCFVFGSGANRMNTCSPECIGFPGQCYNNSSCDTGGGGLLDPSIECNNCFNNFPGPAGSSSGWRVVV